MYFANFVYLLMADFYTNWIMPPLGMPLRPWINILGEIMGNFLDIRIAGRSMVADKILWLCQERNSEVTGIYPTLQELHRLLTNLTIPMPSHEARYRETVVNRLQGLFAAFGDHICSRRLMNWNAYINGDWAISLAGIPTDLQNLFISVEVARILLYRIHNNLRSRELAGLFVFDEASSIFKKWHENAEGTYLLTDYLAQAREFGLGFLISTQTISNLASSVLANTSIKVMVGGAGLGTDYDVFASSVGLTPEQKEFLKHNSTPGFACAKDPRYQFAFTLEVNRIV